MQPLQKKRRWSSPARRDKRSFKLESLEPRNLLSITPIGYWSFDNAANTCGPTLNAPCVGEDHPATGNNNYLSVNGNAAHTASARIGTGALSLDGNGDWLSRGTTVGLPSGNSPYTIAAWVQPVGLNATAERAIAGWGLYGFTNRVTALRLLGDNGINNYWWPRSGGLTASNAQVTAAGVDLDNGAWHHVAATFNGTTRTLWLNGDPIASDSPTALSLSTGNFRVGSACTLSTQCPSFEAFNGRLDDVAIWNEALTSNNIERLAGGWSPLTLLPAGLAANWVAEDLAATLADDAVLTTWTDSASGISAIATGQPTLQTNEINSYSVVRLEQSDGIDLMRVAAANSPVSDADNFSLAVVFRTATTGTGGASQWTDNTGIIDASQPGAAADWGLAMNGAGQIGLGMGDPDLTTYTPSGYADGSAHVAIAVRNGGVTALYLDGGNGIHGDMGTDPRGIADMVFGALAGGGQAFDGDLAEILIFDKALTPAEAANVAGNMGNKYEIDITSQTPPDPPQLVGHWVADDLAAGPVGTWSSRVGPAVATVVNSDPTTIATQLRGHAVVQLDGNDALAISATDNPLGGAGDFTIFAVTRTSTVGTAGTNWWENSGIVDMDVAGDAPDWGLVLDATGRVGAGLGSAARNNVTAYSSTAGLNDGKAHVLAFSRIGTSVKVYVDGAEVGAATGGAAARLANALTIGRIQSGGKFYTGDVAELRMYRGGMNASGVETVSADLSTTYRPIPNYRQTILNHTPTNYYRLSEATNTVPAADEVGTNHGVYNGGPTVGQPGALPLDSNKAVQFDGANDFVRINNTTTLDFTLEAWIKTSANSLPGANAYEGNGIIWSDVGGAGADFVMATLGNRLSFFDGGSNVSINGTTALNNNQWRHIVAVRDGGGQNRIYVDGVLEGSINAGTVPLTQNPQISIGGNTLDNRYFNGLIDEVAIYSRALTAAEIVQHYQAGTALGAPPDALNDTYPATESTLLTVNAAAGVLANDDSPENNPMTAILVSGTQHGTLTLAADGSFTYQPVENYFGPDTFTYRANDGIDSNVATVTINVANQYDAVVAFADHYVVDVTLPSFSVPAPGVLANDVNADNSPLTVQLVLDSTAGALNLAPNGSFTYQPQGIVGAQTFTYRVFDGTSNSNTVTVTLLVDTPPVADNDTFNTNEDQPLSIPAAQGVLLGDTDAQSNPLTAELMQDVTHGTLTLRADGSFDYTPALNYFGADSFTYWASDGDQQSPVATVAINVAARNDTPVAVADTYVGFEGDVITRTAANGVLANDVDVDNTNLTAILVGQPAFGSLTFNSNGSLTYTPPAGFTGTTTFAYKTSDGTTDSPIAIVTLVINSQPIVINEIHYDPADNTSRGEFIELYNAGARPVDVSGWYFSDGIDFVIPQGTVIPADGYLLVAEDPMAIQSEYSLPALGPWVGALSNDGEEVILRDALGERVDRVDYAIGYPWPTESAGGGGSMERIHPVLDGQLGGSWRTSIVQSGLPVDPVTILGAASSNWRYRKGNNANGEPPSNWRQTGYTEDATWLTGRTPIGYGDGDDNTTLTDMMGAYSTVYLRNTFTMPNPMPQEVRLRVYVDDGAIVSINGVEFNRWFVSPGDKAFNSLSGAAGHEAGWVTALITNPTAVFTPGVNTIAIHTLNDAIGSSDLSIDAELIVPGSGDILPEPTPGAQNSVFATNAPPQTRQVDHFPIEPRTTEATTITVRVTDPDGVTSVQAQYQVVLPGQYIPAFLPVPLAQLRINPDTPQAPNPAYHDPANWTTVTMYDDGSHGDAVIGDNVYTAVIPAQAVNRTLVRYRVRVEDTLGAAVTVPYADDDSLNFAYYVYDGVPAYGTHSAADLTSLPVYSFITRPEDWTQTLAWTSDRMNQGEPAWFEYNWHGTMVYDGEVYDNIKYRLRGANGRYLGGNSKRSMKFNFNKGRYFEAKDENGNPYPRKWSILTTGKGFDNRQTLTYAMNEHVNYYLWNQIGVPAPSSHFFHFRVVDQAQEAPDLYNGDFWGLNWAQENYDVRFLESHNLEKGTIYKLINSINDPAQEIRYQGADAVTDGSDYWNIENNLLGTSSTAFIQNHVNLDNWYRFHALAEAVRHYDYWPEANKNFAWYFEPDYTAANNNLGKLWSLPWDTDASWGPTWNAGQDVVAGAVFPSHPELYPGYYNIVRELRDLLWQPDQINPLIDHFAGKIDQFAPADLTRWRNAPAASGNYNGLHGPGPTGPIATWSLAAYVQDMKRFAFTGGQWDGDGSAIQARSVYLDSHQAANGEGGQIPNTPTISYIGAANFPADGLRLQTTAFSDPQGAGSFGAIQWRLASWTDITSPTYNPNEPFKLEYNADWDSGPITTVANTINVPTGATEVGKTYRARVRMQDSTGRWGHWSAPVTLTVTTPQSVINLLGNLRITEVMYNPQGTQDYEFIELLNIGTQSLDLTEVRFGDGVEFSFAGSDVTTLQPGQYAVITPNIAAFRSRYGNGPLVAGQYNLNISNAGEHLELTFGANTIIQDFTIDDTGPGWHPTTDGEGHSLVIIDATGSTATWNDPAAWRPSEDVFGSPGQRDLLVADFNTDNRVSLVDLVFLQGRLGTASGATRLTGDLTADGAVSRGDVAAFVSRFGRLLGSSPMGGSPAAAPAAVLATVRQAESRSSEVAPSDERAAALSGRITATRTTRRPIEISILDRVLADDSTAETSTTATPSPRARRARHFPSP